jgi:hypothetical protein
VHLLPGYEALNPRQREDLRALLERLPGGRLSVDLAWMNCNGQRSLDEISWFIWLETGANVPVEAENAPSLSELFRWTTRLGLTSFRHDVKESWTPRTPPERPPTAGNSA